MTQTTVIEDFFSAIRTGSAERVQLILDQNEVDGKWLNHPYAQKSPIAVAAETGNCEIFQLLLDHGADVNFGGKMGQMPLYIAAKRNHLQAVKICIKGGAVIDQKHPSGKTALLEAVNYGHFDIVKELLKNGSDRFICSNGGDSALHLAAFQGNLPLVQLLLEEGLPADLQKVARFSKVPTGVRPLHLASLGDHHQVVEVLISHGASVNDVTENGNTALHLAAKKNALKTAVLLLQHGCHVDVIGEDHRTPLFSAVEGDHIEMVELLISAGADVNTCITHGNGIIPALVTAAFHDRPDIILALIKGGCDVNAAATGGITPIGACLRNERFTAMMSLTKAGSKLLPKAGSRASTRDLETIFGHSEIEDFYNLVNPCSLQESCRYSIVSHIHDAYTSKMAATDGKVSDDIGEAGYPCQISSFSMNVYANCISRLELPVKLKCFLQFQDLDEIFKEEVPHLP